MLLVQKERDEIIYTQNDLKVYNLLQRPIYVFDAITKSMYYANNSAIKLWNANTLESLLERDFATDMTEATEHRLYDIVRKLERGEQLREQWTLYPNGIPTTVVLAIAGIRIGNDGRYALLCEPESPDEKQFDSDCTVRGIETLLHMPIPVCQFDLYTGNILYQNPEAVNLFGCSTIINNNHNNNNNNHSSSSSLDTTSSNCSHNTTTTSTTTNISPFVSRFVDRELAKSTLYQVQNEEKEGVVNVEAEHYTKKGPRWFSVALRRTRDPLCHSKYILLYSARDITEIIQARKDTTEANLKSEFMAVMAHEIRTPLHQIVGYLDLLEDTTLNESQYEYIQQVQSSASMLISIINDLLDYSKLESGKMQIEYVPFTLDGVIQGCIAAEKPRAELKNITINSTSTPNNIDKLLIGDPNRIRQILLNLVNNAVKFTPPDGNVTLSVQVLEEESNEPEEEKVECNNNNNNNNNICKIRFDVTDTGIGIDPSQQSIVFEKYKQANVSIARNYGGSGLGLPICKQLVELMNGTISLSSELDVGTTISFIIPFGIYQKMPLTATPVKYNNTNKQQHATNTNDGCCNVNNTPEGKNCCNLSKANNSRNNNNNDDHNNNNNNNNGSSLNILVVEDNNVNQKVVCKMLSRMGHIPTIAENGQIALDKIMKQSNNKYGLILMDLQMPVMDGIECTKQIRNVLNINKNTLPILGLTASYQNADLEYYQKIGMNDCLGKPLKLKKLQETIDTFTIPSSSASSSSSIYC